MASNKYKKRRIGFVILLLLLLIAVGVITVTGEINGSKKTGETVTVSIAQGSGTSAIAQELKDAGLISNTTLLSFVQPHPRRGQPVPLRRLHAGKRQQLSGAHRCPLLHHQLQGNGNLALPEGWNSLPDSQSHSRSRPVHRGIIPGRRQCHRL